MTAATQRPPSKPTRRVHAASALPAAHRQLVCTFSPAAGHDKQSHPETASRIAALKKALSQHGLDHQNPQMRVLPPPQLGADTSRLHDVLQLVHPAAYLARLQEICGSLQAPAMIDDSTYIAPGSYVACCEVGS